MSCSRYVLLKERNMLLTTEHYYEKTEQELFPSPERIDKVVCNTRVFCRDTTSKECRDTSIHQLQKNACVFPDV